MSQIENAQLGKFLQVSYSEGIRSQISDDYRDWELIKRARIGDPNGRSVQFLFQGSLGPAAIQYRDAGDQSFPSPQLVSSTEHEARFKEMDVTIEVAYNVWKRAQLSEAKYLDMLALEIQAKATAGKRRLAADLYNDGTGVMGVAASAAVSSDKIIVTLSSSNTARGHVGFFEYDDILVHSTSAGNAAGSAPTNTAAQVFSYWKVVDKDRAANTVTLQPYTSAGAAFSAPGLTAGIAATDNLFRNAISSIAFALITDYGADLLGWPGLESLTADDGRKVHNITMSGSNKGSRKDCGNAAIDVSFFQNALSQAKVRAGAGQYKYPMAVMSPEALDSLIDGRETDRRFNSMEDSKRGTREFVYQHEQDAVRMITSEFCPLKRIYCLPETKGGDGKVLEWHGTDYVPVKVNDSGEFHLKTGSNGYERSVQTFMEGYGTMICKRPGAIAVLHNFTT